MELVRRLPSMPTAPGVYIMRGTSGEALYVGKAKNLRARLRSYVAGADGRLMIPFLMEKTQEIEVIVTGTEKEALILEYNLIKELNPRYNIEFRDDKSYFHLRLDPTVAFPRFQLVRRPRKDQAYYFGPYPSGRAARETLRFLHTLFPLRTCRDEAMRNRSRPCLEYEVKRCPAPCVGYVTEEQYRELVQEGIAFMEGKAQGVLQQLRAKMAEFAVLERFEEAALLRDRIRAIEETIEKQVLYTLDRVNRDVIGICQDEALAVLALLFVREGRMVGQRTFPVTPTVDISEEIISQFLTYYYGEEHEIPDEILIPTALPDQSSLVEWLTDKRGKKVHLHHPVRGEKRRLLDIALANARQYHAERKQRVTFPELLTQLRVLLGMTKNPERIECFDISHFGGTYAVGSQVTFLAGVPHRAAYRHYRIRTPVGADDYAMMYEVLMRRLTRGPIPNPDLIVVDGGKGQLSVALSALKDAGKGGIATLAIAKGDGERDDQIFIPPRKDPLPLKRYPEVLHLLQHLRNEAHRFAVTYARKVKERGDFSSVLDGLVSAKQKRMLLAAFPDVEGVKEATKGDLQAVPGIGEKQQRKFGDTFMRSNHETPFSLSGFFGWDRKPLGDSDDPLARNKRGVEDPTDLFAHLCPSPESPPARRNQPRQRNHWAGAGDGALSRFWGGESDGFRLP